MKFHYLPVFIFLYFLLSFSLNAGISDSCKYVITGKIIDGETNKPFAGASIILVAQDKAVIADEKGEFSLRGLCQGVITLKYSVVGYKSLIKTYTIKNKNPNDVIILHTDTCDLPSITIHGTRTKELNSLSKSTLEGEELEKTRGLSLGEALKGINGVYVLQTGPSINKPVIHGMHSNRIIVMNNGLRQEGQQWGSEHAPEIDPYLSQKLTIVKGAAGVKYGSDAVGGVVITEAAPLPDSAGMKGILNLAGFSNNRMGVTSGILEGNSGFLKGLGWRVQGTYKKGGDAFAPRYNLSNTAYEEQNFSFSTGYKKEKWGVNFFYSQFNTKLGILLSSHIGSLTDLVNAIERQQPVDVQPFTYEIRRPFQDVQHELGKVTGYRQTAIGKITFTGGYQFNIRREFDRHRPYNQNWRELPQLTLALRTLSVDLILEHKRIGKLNGTIGLSSQFQDNEYSGRYLIPFFKSESGGLFLIERLMLGKLELEAGFRYDLKQYRSELYFLNSITNNNEAYTSSLLFQSPSGNLGLIYNIGKNAFLRNNVGFTFRPPSVNELYSNGLHHGCGCMEYGDTLLQPEKAIKWISSFESKSTRWEFDLSVYANYIRDFIFRKPIFPPVQTVRGAFVGFKFSKADAVFYGIDASAAYNATKQLNISARISLLNTWNYTEQDYLIFTPPYRATTGVKYSPEIPLINTSKYKPYIEVTSNFVARQNRVPSRNDREIGLPNNAAIQITGGDYMPAPNGYVLVSAGAGFNLPVNQQTVLISFQVNNLFNTSYREYLDNFRYYADMPGRNFILRIKIPFNIYKSNNP